jgi:tetratricopeptide (TPR) repeat protein|tara:strand:+ start:886 stop:2010 length:1125 start_codon:yes stop_codon:yes gene_type:complete
MLKKYGSLASIISLIFIISCGTKPQSDVDTPEYHFKAGMRAIENGDFQQAIKSFQRSVDLDKKFALGYGGLGLAHANLGNNKDAKNFASKCASRGSKDPEALSLSAQVWITMRSSEKRWFKRAEDYLKTALKRDKEHEGSQYWFGVAYLYNYQFDEAEDYFRKVVNKRGEYSGKADSKWKLSQKIVRAMPGTPAGKKVALKERINRADLAVLFAEELKIGVLFDRMPVQSSGFQTPSQASQTATVVVPNDSRDHWAETWIKDMIRYGIMNVEPDGNFYPDDDINRANYAMAVQRLLVVATRDESLETKYFGEAQSRFSDVPASHFAYNAMAICTERGIMEIDMMNNRFNPTGDVTGADALLIIRNLQNSLRMTF